MYDQSVLNKIRKLVITGIFADDILLDKFVLKGGSAFDLIYEANYRPSVDVDVSMEEDFSEAEFDEIKFRIENSLNKIFEDEGYSIFDFEFRKKPKKPNPKQPDFWGGYIVEFKIIEKQNESIISDDIEKARKQAAPVGDGGKKTFEIDISKYEYCKEEIVEHELEGFIIYVYTPKLLVLEKFRAICQQSPEYAKKVHSTYRPRPKDFYDIYHLVENLNIEFSKDDYELLEKVFDIKQVPIKILFELEKYRDFHEQDFEEALQDTVTHPLESFDFYFNYVLDIVEVISN